MQGLGGAFGGLNRGASMSGNRPGRAGAPYFQALSPGQTSWAAPHPGGKFTIIAIGGGGSTGAGVGVGGSSSGGNSMGGNGAIYILGD